MNKMRLSLPVLKFWFDAHPFDIDAVAYDASQPLGETIGQRVNTRNAANLLALFKAERSAPTQKLAQFSKWFTPKKLFVGAIIVGCAGLYFLRSTKSDDKQSNADEAVPAVSLRQDGPENTGAGFSILQK